MSTTESSTEQFSLQQRYEATPRQILATGIQALVRLPIDLMRADRVKGWNTAAFISGYQGSPLGGYDRELQSQRKLLDELNIVHVPGLNEELAATSVFGSQVAQTYALDPALQEFFARSNPWAMQAITERLLEASQRGLWQQPREDT
ncbi:MAG: cobaltochelatase subunit CobN, partial [Ilumatobacteraceae bacterium]